MNPSCSTVRYRDADRRVDTVKTPSVRLAERVAGACEFACEDVHDDADLLKIKRVAADAIPLAGPCCGIDLLRRVSCQIIRSCNVVRNAAALPKPDQAIGAASAQPVVRVFTFGKEDLEHTAIMRLGRRPQQICHCYEGKYVTWEF